MHSCSVCLEPLPPPLSSGELVATLDCGHHYHDLCIKAWSERTNTCPTCRTKFNTVALRKDFESEEIVNHLYMEDKTAPKVCADEDELTARRLQEEEWSRESDMYERDVDDGCVVCGNDNGIHDGELLQCAGCDKSFHWACVDLLEQPYSEWYCPFCEVDGESGIFEFHDSRMIVDTRRQVQQRRRYGSRVNFSAAPVAPPPLPPPPPPPEVKEIEIPPEEALAWEMFEQANNAIQNDDDDDEAGQSTSGPASGPSSEPERRKFKRPTRRHRPTNNSNSVIVQPQAEQVDDGSSSSMMHQLLNNIRCSASDAKRQNKVTLEKKHQVQLIVRDALRPEYRAGKIDKDQYTNINKRVSRKLYDLVQGEVSLYKDKAMELVSNELRAL